MKTVGIVTKPTKEGVGAAIGQVRAWCERHGLDLVVDEKSRAVAPSGTRLAGSRAVLETADLLFAFGGDGTLLFAAREAAELGRATPIIGVNMGSLGFLTQIAREDLPEVLARLDPGSLPLSERMMLTVTKSGAEGAGARLALNDVVIAKEAESKMLSFEARAGGELVTRYAADGLILSTPTGSTAYSVSAGGPVVMPTVEAIVATPICPHTLSMRPVVIDPRVVIEVEMVSADGPAIVTADGLRVLEVGEGESISVRKAEARALLVDVAEHTYYEILRKKMRWAGRLRER
jgi:NAD+ kinase